jgi:hypothetical protein
VTERLPRRPAHEAFAAHTGAQLYALSHEPELVVEEDADPLFAIENPLVAAVHRAFSEHRPLRLTPDHLWLTLSQGFAFHVDNHAEALRGRFVRHEGRAQINVEVDHPPFTEGGWARVIERFGEGIREHVGPGVHRLLVSDFSTTTPIVKTASEVVMMSAFKRYFDYRMVCICGIPSITLEGTPEDWRKIRERVDVLGEYELSWWTSRLAPVVDEFVRTAEGHPDPDFWQCIYMPSETYGGKLLNGWLPRLFPYLKGSGGEVRARNDAGMADYDHERREVAPWAQREKTPPPTPERARWMNPGVSPTSLPSGVSEAPLTVVFPREGGGEDKRPLRLFGGFIGVTQDEAGVVAPEIGWALGEPMRMAVILDALEDDAHIKRAPAGEDVRGECPGALLQLYDRYAEVTLHGRYRVRPAQERYTVVGSPAGFQGVPVAELTEGYVPGETLVLTALVELRDDPRWIGLLEDDFCCVLVDPRVAQGPLELPVVADNIEALLEGLLDSGEAPFFDAPDFQASSALYDHLRHSDILRAALQPGHVPPSDLNPRESEKLILALARREGSRAERNHWWAALQATHGLDDGYRKVIEKQRGYPIDVLRDLGLRE